MLKISKPVLVRAGKYDWDKDGKSAETGDCDETCIKCYSGSLFRTSNLDGKDQNCNGIIDEPVASNVFKNCPATGYHYYNNKSMLDSTCNTWCQSRGIPSGSVSCSRTVPPPYTWGYSLFSADTYSWDSCVSSGDAIITDPACTLDEEEGDTVSCYCATGIYYQ